MTGVRFTSPYGEPLTARQRARQVRRRLAWQVQALDRRRIVQGVARYSGRDLDGLYLRYAYPKGGAKLPVVLVIHGFIQEVNDLPLDHLKRLAEGGVLAVGVAMRGRDGSPGKPDAAGAEVDDVLDALTFVRRRFSGMVGTAAAVVGYSGGGAIALACAARSPEAFAVVVSHYGVSDYGAWWHQIDDKARSVLTRMVGGTPESHPDAYAARRFVEALRDYPGEVFLFHDAEDRKVPLDHSRVVAEAVPRAHSCFTGPGDEPRWHHGSGDVRSADYWLPALFAQ